MNSRNFALVGILSFVVALLSWSSSPAQQEGENELIELIVQLLGDSDKDMRALGLEQIRTKVPGPVATARFAAQLPQLPADVQVELIRALTDRADAAARPVIVAQLKASDSEPVRLAALRSLGYLGQAEDLDLLLMALASGADAERAAARASLGRLPAETLSAQIAEKLSQGDAALRKELMRILVTRRAFDQADALLPLAVGQDAGLRAEAMTALSQLAGPDQVAGMVQGILAAEPGREREAAEKAVMLVCQRGEDPATQADPLLAAMRKLGDSEQEILLSALGRVGGPAALAEIKKALASSGQLHSAGLRAVQLARCLGGWRVARAGAD